MNKNFIPIISSIAEISFKEKFLKTFLHLNTAQVILCLSARFENPEVKFIRSWKFSFWSNSYREDCFTSPEIFIVFPVGFMTIASFDWRRISVLHSLLLKDHRVKFGNGFSWSLLQYFLKTRFSLARLKKIRYLKYWIMNLLYMLLG